MRKVRATVKVGAKGKKAGWNVWIPLYAPLDSSSGYAIYEASFFGNAIKAPGRDRAVEIAKRRAIKLDLVLVWIATLQRAKRDYPDESFDGSIKGMVVADELM